MSENILEPIVDSMVETSKVLIKHINKLLGLNTLDFKQLFKELGLCNKSEQYPKLYNIINTSHFKTYQFTVPIGISIKDFEKHTEAIEQFMQVDNVSIVRNNKLIEFKVLIGMPKANYDIEQHKRKDFKVPLGYALNNNKLVLWDITSNNNCHCYIAGSSGGGKSITLRLILSHLVNSKSKRDIEFSIINTKRVDLKDFEHCKHTRNYMIGTEGVEDFLQNEVEEMERRYILLEKNDCDDLGEYRAKGNRIPYRLIVVEEISSYKGNKEYQRNIELLASQGRGAGLILLMVTQLPSAEIMPNTIKCNVNSTIGLKTKDSIRSEIIAGEGANLHKLKGNGHSKLFCGDHDGTEYQGLYIDKETMKDIIKANLKQNKRAVRGATPTTHGDNKNFDV